MTRFGSIVTILAVAALVPATASAHIAFDAEYFVTPTGAAAGLAIAAGDWNGDGRDDVVVLHSDGTLLAMLGRGDLALTPVSPVAVPDAPRAVATADLDGDGDADLVVAGARTHVLAGDGAGGFAFAADFDVAGEAIAIADFGGDGILDLAIGGETGIHVAHLGTGFLLARRDTLAARSGSIGAADLDGDHDLDLVSTERVGIRVWLNDGVGGWSPAADFGSFDYPVSLSIGDLNADEIPDVATVTPNRSYCCSDYLGAGDGSFVRTSAASTSRAVPHGTRRTPEPNHIAPTPHFVRLQDLDGDGDPEAITVRRELGVEVMNRRSLRYAEHAVAANVDGEGRPEIVVVGRSEVAVHVVGADGFPVSRQAARFWYGFWDAQLGDVDGDGRLDAAIRTTEDFHLFRGVTGGGFESIASGVTDVSPPFAFLDFDDDGDLDLLSRYTAHAGQGDGTFTEIGAILPGPMDVVASGDVDEDGIVDVLAVLSSDPQRVTFLRGDGAGGFAAAGAFDDPTYQLDLADLDGDGHLDVVGRADGGFVRYGDGAGGFSARVALGAGNLQPLLLGDVDGDGALDLVTSGPYPAEPALVFLGRGRSFDLVTNGFVGRPTALADFDSDGKADVVVNEHEFLSVWRGSGTGTFDLQRRFGPGGRTLVDDRDGDGRADLLVMRTDDEHGDDGNLSILRNLTDAEATPTLLALIAARVRAGDVELVWHTSDRTATRGVVSRTPDGIAWMPAGEVALETSGRARFEDRGLAPGRWGYRLELETARGLQRSAVTWVDVRPEALRIEAVRPQPSTGATSIAFILVRPGSVETTVLDLQGRVAARRRWDALAAGAHVRPLDLALAPGVYTIVLRQGAEWRTTRMVVAR